MIRNRQHRDEWAVDPQDLLVQRCVDGELDETEERMLLQQLDLQPSGWRQLALTFVEQRLVAQACRQAIEPQVHLAPRAVQPRRTALSMDVVRWTALAAAWLVAFAVGRFWPASNRIEPARLAQSGATAATHAEPESAVPSVSTISDVPVTVTSPPSAARMPMPAMIVDLLVPGLDQPVQVPVYHASSPLAEAWPETRSALSPQEVDAFRRAGYAVASQRDVLRFQSPEGHELMLPVEAVNVQMTRY